MNKFLKLNLFSLEVSIKQYDLIIVQRMYNSNTNTTIYNLENKNAVSDNVTRQDLDNVAFIPSNENQLANQVNQCLEGIANQQHYNYYTHFFNNPVLSVPEFALPNYNYLNYLPPAIYYCGAPIYSRNINPFIANTRNFHISHGNQKNRRRFLKRFGMDITALRSWQNVEVKPSSKPGFIFTIMSFNVLAQDLLENHPHLYHLHDTTSLTWEKRWDNLLKEISHFQPDILCLQEVQYTHINEYYIRLETLGYTGVFKKQTGARTDGCALYYKTDKLQMVKHNLVNFFQPTVSLLNRHNVGIVAKFTPKLHPTREFVVATTHLLYNPRRHDVRLAQMQLLLTDVEKMSYKHDNDKPYYLPVIITGDLNSPPYSDLYEYVTKGEIKYENLSPALLQTHSDTNKQILVTSCLGITDNSQYLDDIQKRTSSESITVDLDKRDEIKHKSSVQKLDNESKCESKGSKKVCKTKTLSHNFGLKSVYEHGSQDNNEGTTYQNEWVTVDYIFYSGNECKNEKENKLHLLSRYRLPRREEVDGIKIPNHVVGSDHISLLAKFKLEF